MNLELKTLLLCNISPTGKEQNFLKLYQDVEELAGNSSSDSHSAYFTMGGVDATCVYTTPCSNQEKWLEAVLADKKHIIKKLRQEITYHPIHLIRYLKEDEKATDHSNTHRFLLVTFVYGLESLSSLKELQNTGPETEIELYQCINISDRVILTYTDDLLGALEKIRCWETKESVRKTYTTINLLLNSAGEIEEEIIGKIRAWDREISACIRGSIRSNTKWITCYNKIRDALNKKDTYFQNYGEADFSISIPKLSGQLLANLLDYYQNQNNDSQQPNITLAEACWDIHTELQIEGCPLDKSPEKSLPNVLTNICQPLSDNLRTLSVEHPEWDWVAPLQELLSAQVSIERNPVLHGPSYLLWDSFRIFNDYFTLLNQTANSPIQDIQNTDKLISESHSGFERSIRCLSLLTDQLTRNDDIIFRGIGRIPAITTTLPENLLEFYLSFLRNLASFLVKIDQEYQMKPEQYRYAFLIAPEHNQRPRIFQVLNADYRYKKDNEQNAFYSWPAEQIHIIQLPINDVFRPSQCMIPLAHECFHFFGDYMRCRGDRAKHMANYLACSYSEYFTANEYITDQNKNNLRESAFQILLPKPPKGVDLYLSSLRYNLLERFKYLLSDIGTNDLFHRMARDHNWEPSFLLYTENIRKRRAINASIISNQATSKNIYIYNRDILTPQFIVDYCCYYFRECYADFMSIITLQLNLSEYLSVFKPELPSMKEKYENLPPVIQSKLVQIGQRIAIVFSALNKYTGGNNSDLYKHALQYEGFDDYLSEIIITVIDSFLDEEKCVLDPFQYPGVSTASSLRNVVDYLHTVGDRYKDSIDDTTRKQLHTTYDSLIRKEQMFCEYVDNSANVTSGDDIIRENRKRVKDESGFFSQM